MTRLLVLPLLLFSLVATAQKSLSRTEAEALALRLADEWKAERRNHYETAMATGCITYDTLRMRLFANVFGRKAPEGGRSLWISLHGGGTAPAAVNDQQWRNQGRLYAPREGVYVAPRAAYDDWDMHCKPLTDTLYRQLIEMAVACFDVNPDRVYLLGYSAGGDGVWRLAPRLADRWAAASMMAGHPGSVSQLNLRNLPYMIWCGALDAAYDRNTLNARRILELDSLRTADPDGYVHEGHIIEGKGHWMDRMDTAAIAWMAKHTRNPYPRRIVWRQEEVTQPSFYWLSAPADERQEGKTVRVEISGQTVNISQCDYSRLTIWLNDSLLDLDRKVEVRFNGKRLFRGRLKRTEANMRESLSQRGDTRYVFPAKLTVNVR